ncbi:protoporphyrinogen oxidase [Metabacillus sp. GX 13764]|uniref:protoporphyrinogen oxidase n=1 Tax=Metabacillus kandeliae TaxID=2900151 RepID=UPI001E3A8E5B|nr:protoporphyrinogen oxidase [Metabacillus kandeliae]MCD7034870.1 protoporphyrinogen oxidase [Metabacillus kandeliae]
MKKTIIIGGGLTGLSAAFYLEKEAKEKGLPLSIDLIESSPRLGGKIQTVSKDGYVIERGPDSFLERKASAPELMKDLGIEDQLVNNAVGRSYVLVKDELHSIPAGAVMGIPTQVAPFITSGLFSLPGKLRAAGDFVLPAGKAKGDQSLGMFFRRRLGNEVVENLIEPLLSGIYAGDIDKLSLMTTFPQFYQVEQEHRSLILGMKKTTPKNTQKHLPKRKKGIFQTLTSGLESIVPAFEEKLSLTSIHKGNKVQKLEKLEDGRYSVLLSDGASIQADTVILAVPHAAAASLMKDEQAFAYFKKMPSTSVATAALAFPKDAVKMDKEGTGFVISRNSDYTITACTWTHKKWPHTAPPDKAVLRAYVGKPGHEAIVDQSDDEIVKVVMEDLRKVMDISAEPEMAVVTRWKEAMPQYNVGHKQKIAEIKEEVKKKYPGLYLAGASYEGIGLPDCIDQGMQAVQDVLEFLGK